MRLRSVVGLSLIAAVGGCASLAQGGHSGPGICRPAAAKALTGHAAPDDAEILRRTGSAIIRRLAPGDIATKDFREERVTITVDGGKVVSASCG